MIKNLFSLRIDESMSIPEEMLKRVQHDDSNNDVPPSGVEGSIIIKNYFFNSKDTFKASSDEFFPIKASNFPGSATKSISAL